MLRVSNLKKPTKLDKLFTRLNIKLILARVIMVLWSEEYSIEDGGG